MATLDEIEELNQKVANLASKKGMLKMQSVVYMWAVSHKEQLGQVLIDSLISACEEVIKDAKP